MKDSPASSCLRVALLCGVIFACAQGSANAQWAADGNRVCAQPGQQFRSALLKDDAGGFYIAWEDGRQLDENIIVCLRVTHEGGLSASWPAAGLLLSTEAGGQSAPVIVSDAGGGSIVSWAHTTGTGLDIRAQRISPAGELFPAWPAAGVQVCGGSAGFPVMTGDGTGGAFIAWHDPRQSEQNMDIYAQRLTGAGAIASGWPTNGVALTTAPETEIEPAVAPAGEGGCYIAWATFSDGNVFLRRITASGAISPDWPPDPLVVCAAMGTQGNIVAAPDGIGGVILAWTDARSDEGDIYAQHIAADGSIVPGWAPDGLPVCQAPRDQSSARIVVLPSGDIVVAWQDFRNGAQYQVYAQRISSAGAFAPGWPVDGLPVSGTPSDGWITALVADDAEGILVTWSDRRSDEGDVYAQRIMATGTVAEGWPLKGVPLCTALGRQFEVAIATDREHGAIVSWTDRREDPLGAAYQVYVARVTGAGLTGPSIPVVVPRVQFLTVRPNPMRSHVDVTFELTAATFAEITVFDASGRLVATPLAKQWFPGGTHTVPWDGRVGTGGSAAAGLYFMRLATPEEAVTRKLVRLP